jgi:hypothetical protein
MIFIGIFGDGREALGLGACHGTTSFLRNTWGKKSLPGSGHDFADQTVPGKKSLHKPVSKDGISIRIRDCKFRGDYR